MLRRAVHGAANCLGSSSKPSSDDFDAPSDDDNTVLVALRE
jgi:hypothetical protein